MKLWRPGQFMWDLWRTGWHWLRDAPLRVLRFSSVNIVPPLLHNYPCFIYGSGSERFPVDIILGLSVRCYVILSTANLFQLYITKTIRFILNNLYLLNVQEELYKLLVAHPLAPAGQRYSVNARTMYNFSSSTLLQILLLKLLNIILYTLLGVGVAQAV
jgi:hypothetical protein